jgi:hypothetical protein
MANELNKKMAEDLRAALQAYQTRNLRLITETSTALDVEAVNRLIQADYARLSILADLIADGHIETAKSWAHELETAVREEIPAHVWVFLGGRLVKEI